MKVVFHYDTGSGLTTDLKSLVQQGITVQPVSADDCDGFTRAMHDCDVLWHVLKPVTRKHINNAPKLKLIQKIGVGVNTIDVAAADAKGIAVCNMPGTNAQAVAEMTLLLMLSTLRRAPYFDTRTRRGDGWSFSPDIQDSLSEIAGKTVGFVGYGDIPQRLTPILKSMGTRILYNATAPKDVQEAEYRELDQLLVETDILSLHVPLTPATENLITAASFKKMKRGAILINTARGNIVDQDDLVDALKNGDLGAAGLDVFQTEPVSADNPLLQLENVSVMPHISWLTRETLDRSIAVAVENCIRLRESKPLLHRVSST